MSKVWVLHRDCRNDEVVSDGDRIESRNRSLDEAVQEQTEAFLNSGNVVLLLFG